MIFIENFQQHFFSMKMHQHSQSSNYQIPIFLLFIERKALILIQFTLRFHLFMIVSHVTRRYFNRANLF